MLCPRVSSAVGTGWINTWAAEGMGTVWAGFDTQLDRPVAVKLVRHSGEHSALIRGKLASEARAVAQLQHPGIVQVYDFGIDSLTGPL